MIEKNQFTIEEFYKNVGMGKITGGKCRKCGTIHLPPRPLCSKCYGEEFEWITLPNDGILLTYTVIHISTPQFQNIVPYPVGIMKITNKLKLPGIIRGIPQTNLNIGMKLRINIEKNSITRQWPSWPRYYFTSF